MKLNVCIQNKIAILWVFKFDDKYKIATNCKLYLFQESKIKTYRRQIVCFFLVNNNNLFINYLFIFYNTICCGKHPFTSSRQTFSKTKTLPFDV